MLPLDDTISCTLDPIRVTRSCVHSLSRPLDHSLDSALAEKAKKKKTKKKGHQNLRWGSSTTGGPSTTRSLRSIDHSQKRQKEINQNICRGKEEEGASTPSLDHWVDEPSIS